MPYDPERHHRRSIRLRGYDYTQPGAYFVTICTRRRAHLFGHVAGGRMHRNAYGDIVAAEWHRTAQVRPTVVVDAFVVMPDHVHGIIGIVDCDGDTTVGSHRRCDPTECRCDPTACRCAPTPCRCAPTPCRCAPTPCRGTATPCRCGWDRGVPPRRRFGGAVAGSLPTIMRQFKSMVTKRINRMRGAPGASVWQRGYWEHIIRDEHALARIRRYIIMNPQQWHAGR